MRNKISSKKGNALITVLLFLVIFFIMTAGLLSLVSTEVHMCRRQYESTKAFFLAEAGIERAMASLRDTATIPASITYKLAVTGIVNDSPGLDDVTISISSQSKGNNLYAVTSSATVNNSTRIVKAEVLYNPPSHVFDYVYFINNWGWFYGSGIIAEGDIRSNGRFDFKYSPKIDGEVYAGQDIGGGDQITGKAATKQDGSYIYQHPKSPVLDMPNLQNLNYYQALALDKKGTVKIGTKTLINGVLGDEAGENGKIILIGTTTEPIEVDGPTVVTGDVIIKGAIKGQGTIYAGRNVYIAGDVKYNNGPSSPRPDSDDPDVVSKWVTDNKDKDLVGLAATENVVLGDYTKSSYYGYKGSDPWYANGWLFSMGSEDVGKDGIPDTLDAGENDGKFDKKYEDIDEDGTFDDNYNWQDVQTQASIKDFANVPQVIDGGSTRTADKFSDIASNNISNIDGIYYTNHAFAGRVGYNTKINGAIISKDEAIIYRDYITMNYDERVHSKYRDNPNWLIDLCLPYSEKVAVVSWWEEAPK